MVGVVVVSGNYVFYVFCKHSSTMAHLFQLCIGGQGALATLNTGIIVGIEFTNSIHVFAKYRCLPSHALCSPICTDSGIEVAKNDEFFLPWDRVYDIFKNLQHFWVVT